MKATTLKGGYEKARDKALEAIRQGESFFLTTHENPDGDGLGSMLAMHEGLLQIGKDSVMSLSENEFPLPDEYKILGLDDVRSKPPDDWQTRTAVLLDCGNIDRIPAEYLQHGGAHVINIDHHHDNTFFGDVNLVVPEASSTAEIVYGLLKELGVDINARIATALYVAVVTDTGKFMYKNTGPKTHVMAAELIECGVDIYGVFRGLYEDMPIEKLSLLARVLSRVERYDDGVLTMAQLLREDYDFADAEATFSEGIVDYIRAVRGTKVAALVREMVNSDGSRLKVSLRATDDQIDVSTIAREAGGGGHSQAAGFTTDLPIDKVIEFLRAEVSRQLT